MNRHIRDKGRSIPILCVGNHKVMWRCLTIQSVTRSLSSLFSPVTSKERRCFTTLVSSEFTTNSAQEDWKALIVCPYLTQWLLNGFKPINQTVTRSIAAGSVSKSHNRPSAQQSVHKLISEHLVTHVNAIQNLKFLILTFQYDPAS